MEVTRQQGILGFPAILSTLASPKVTALDAGATLSEFAAGAAWNAVATISRTGLNSHKGTKGDMGF